MTRRTVLRVAAAIGGGFALAGTGLLGRDPRRSATPAPWGPLAAVRDRATGLPLLRLPAGFSYVSFGWTGDPLTGDLATPGEHDGMGVVRVADGRATLVRNHEVRGPAPAFAGSPVYDRRKGGGTTTLVFDLAAGRWVSASASLAGTSTNCSGGVTPWGTWLSCEESVARGAEPHGFVFEVPADGVADPEPLHGLGRFAHEAIAVDPSTGIVYQTEDHERAGFYRFVPNVPGELRRGGRLQMLRVVGQYGARLARWSGIDTPLSVDWVDIDEPGRAHGLATSDGSGVLWQGRLQGGATFRRLEGCWWADGGIYFVSTDGGAAWAGQVWHHHVGRSDLRLVLEAGGRCDLQNPDGATGMPSRSWLACEDRDRSLARLVVTSAAGDAWPFAENAVELAGERNGFEGDFSDAPWTGPTFAGDWLFANLERPGLTVAITGPWDRIRV